MDKAKSAEPDRRVVPADDAVMVEAVGVVGATADGEHFGVELRLGEGRSATLLFPSALFPPLMAGLSAAGAAAQSALVARLGSEQAALDHVGARPIVPTGWGVARARTRDGAERLLIRLDVAGAPVVDAAFSLGEAEALASDMLRALEGPPARRRRQ
jgi:hypothetical protein